MAFSKIGLIGKYGDPSVAGALLRIAGLLKNKDCEVWLDASTAEHIPEHNLAIADFDELGQKCDLAITVGGDGTLLHTARSLVDHKIALLGVNLGHLGFLVDVSPEQLEKQLDEVISGVYVEEHRIMLTATIENANESDPRISDAFNDVVIHKWEVARMIEAETYIDGRLLNTMRSDGLIISTPTGSTAYALSGGGPILAPDMDAVVIVPICPHSMSYRPIVLDGASKIEVLVRENPHSHAQVTCDGQINMGLVSGDKIRIERKQTRVRLIHPPEHNHYHVLREKLRWSEHL
ncbi:MAG TPA: NAD(+) kinase [Gammaproteobacteria bacterium]|nr:NAD(+) kinase [Gammaproteobacteria bacterium]